jgi:formylglycine-generating enzyme required for sulfatase activity
VPAGQVHIEPFLLDVNEVTNQEMVEVLNSLGGMLTVVEDEDDHYPRFVRFGHGLGHDDQPLLDLDPDRGGIEYAPERHFRTRQGRERLPVVQVTQYGAQLYCRTRGKRLPTEDEWEAAARGVDNRSYPWGASAAQCGGVVVPNDGRIRMDSSCSKTAVLAQVGQSTQDVTPEGLRDLAGNAAEWTVSSFVDGSRLAHPQASPSELPVVVRGGSWAGSFMARSSGRLAWPPDSLADNIGFRCARGANVGSHN